MDGAIALLEGGSKDATQDTTLETMVVGTQWRDGAVWGMRGSDFTDLTSAPNNGLASDLSGGRSVGTTNSAALGRRTHDGSAG